MKMEKCTEEGGKIMRQQSTSKAKNQKRKKKEKIGKRRGKR